MLFGFEITYYNSDESDYYMKSKVKITTSS